jgi:hypothetical protein
MIRFCVLLASILFFLPANAQKRINRAYIDSLKTAAKQHDDDTNRAICYYRLCWEFRSVNTDTAKMYGE